MLDRRLAQNFDWPLLGITLVIILIGLLNLYSASASFRGAPTIFLKQCYWLLIGLSLMLIICMFDYRIFERLAYAIYIISVLLLILVLVMGEIRQGAQRWLEIGGFSLQPSELVKLSLVLALAKYFQDNWLPDGFRLRELIFPFLLMGIPAFLIILQPDLGSAVLLLFIAFSLLLFARIKLRSLANLAGSGLMVLPVFWFFLKDYQRRRLLSFLDPDRDPLGSGYHLIQSKIAVGSGEFLGKRFLQGTQTQLHFLPEQHTDFVFSVWAEEWGFLGSVIVLSLYLFLILWGLSIASRSKDRFGAILAVGISAILFCHVAVNIGMVVGFLPVVGVTLPLMSYGGSSLIITLIGVGLLLNISMRRYMF
ncbi:MAG: rod shape-determining protein RodA [Deltaproteobacteria bacterium]|nr:MAG: rod shape-determining protein RodA [Deltaproteobacteria bacterium]